MGSFPDVILGFFTRTCQMAWGHIHGSRRNPGWLTMPAQGGLAWLRRPVHQPFPGCRSCEMAEMGCGSCAGDIFPKLHVVLSFLG
jgi:hypothetical protein